MMSRHREGFALALALVSLGFASAGVRREEQLTDSTVAKARTDP